MFIRSNKKSKRKYYEVWSTCEGVIQTKEGLNLELLVNELLDAFSKEIKAIRELPPSKFNLRRDCLYEVIDMGDAIFLHRFKIQVELGGLDAASFYTSLKENILMFDPEASIGMETEIYFSTKHKDYLV